MKANDANVVADIEVDKIFMGSGLMEEVLIQSSARGTDPRGVEAHTTLQLESGTI